MGATNFEDIAFGKTAGHAFRAAYDQAVWEFGHDGYNGTISTVQGFREFVKPKSLSDDEFEAMVWEFEFGGSIKLDLPVRRKFKDDWDRKQYMRDRKMINSWKKLTVAEQRLIQDASKSIQKWECCVCYKADAATEKRHREYYGLKGKHGNVYKFFGLASC